MFYYHVWVRSEQYRSREPLTYQYADKLADGTFVRVPLRKEIVYGFVTAAVAKPLFATKPIVSVLSLPALPATSRQLATWLLAFYPAPIGVITGQFMPAGLRDKAPTLSAIEMKKIAEGEPALTTRQQEAVTVIDTKADTYLLHGRTGSGKTRIYIELTKRTLDNGRSVLILSPEIGLTSQLALQFQRAFGDRIIILHSQLTQKQRELAWTTIICSTVPLIVIGARSAIFSPIRNLGLIVVDEFHDQAYKQEQAPYYHTVRVASQLRSIHSATLVLGSATPSVSDYYFATQKHKPILRLSELAKPSEYARTVTIVDLKEREHFSRAPHLSTALITAMTASLDKHEQVMLYLNRRGTARVTLCEVCGWQARCPNCDLPLTYHGDVFQLQCHVCGYRRQPPRSCPTCGNPSISFHSFGTKAIVDETQRLFPEAKIIRLDTDIQKTERLEHHYQDIVAGNVDVIVGTQMVTKGLDLPKLSTLGIILADSSMYLPDYTAAERTYQLLTQVIGRIGRGHVASHAIIQTYQPKSTLLQAALDDDWESFYRTEISERRQYAYPPFYFLLKLSIQRKTPANAEQAAVKLKETLLHTLRSIEIDGPAPAFHEKTGALYRWQLVIKSPSRQQLLNTIDLLPPSWSYDLDPQDLL